MHTGNFADDRSSLLLTLLANVMLAPVLIFAPFTGAWVDRWNLRGVLIVSDTLRAVFVGLIPVLYLASGNTFPVFALVFCLFMCNVFFLPAKSAITPEIVPASQLLPANAWLAAAGITATAIGALGGGWVVDHWGWPTALWINTLTYLASVVALALIQYRPHAVHGAMPQMNLRAYLSEVRQGWQMMRHNRGVELALIALSAVWVGGGFLHVAGNQHIQRSALKPGMERLGVLMAVLGLGAALGTWWVHHQGRRFRRSEMLGGGLVVTGGSLVAFGLSSHFAVFAAAAFFAGLGAAPSFTLAETLLQESTEPRQRGRVFSARDFLMRLMFLIAVSLAGAMTRSLGTRVTLLTCAGIVVASGVVALIFGRGGRGEGQPPVAEA